MPRSARAEGAHCRYVCPARNTQGSPSCRVKQSDTDSRLKLYEETRISTQVDARAVHLPSERTEPGRMGAKNMVQLYAVYKRPFRSIDRVNQKRKDEKDISCK